MSDSGDSCSFIYNFSIILKKPISVSPGYSQSDRRSPAKEAVCCKVLAAPVICMTYWIDLHGMTGMTGVTERSESQNGQKAGTT
jgi:hypothetical protein